jgi:hypothetical protein
MKGARHSFLLRQLSVTAESLSDRRRAGWFTALLVLVSLVADGYSGRPSEWLHQLLLLPVTALFLYCVYRFLNVPEAKGPPLWTAGRAAWLAVVLELWFFGVLAYECVHFAAVGYRFRPVLAFALLTPALVLLVAAAVMRPLRWRVVAAGGVAAYLAGAVVSIASYPLTYLRSDMLAVVLWADQNMLRGINPYATMHVVGRVYDFPYLPGVLLVYAPFVAAHVDIRWGSVFYLGSMAAVALWAARRERRLETAAVVALLLVSPFLQYRHELYIEPHWFALVLALALFARGRYAWAAVVFGFSMGIYQLSWVLFPFFVLQGFWRKGWTEALKLFALGVVGFVALDGALLMKAFHRVASNTVGQWNALPHALAEPMNLAYWATYVIRPAHLQRLQAALMVAIFAWCVVRRRCVTAADAVRWMTGALTVFLLFNVIIDGYFYLTLLVLAMAYTCIANEWWGGADEIAER